MKTGPARTLRGYPLVLSGMRLAPLLPLVLLLGPFASAAEPAPSFSGLDGALRVPAPRLELEAAIDGVLDEPAWAVAARLTGFSQYSPADGRPADDATEVLVWYSPTALHLGVRASAPPGTVRATLSSRDRISTDDQVLFFLSPFDDGRQALLFAVNPLGVQADGALVEGTRREGGGFGGLASDREDADLSPDFVFDSKGRLTEAGFEVELRIPFKSLRFPSAATQDWGLHVTRIVQRSGREDSWAPAKRSASSFLAQAGKLAGLTGISSARVLDVIPEATARRDGGPGPADAFERNWATPEVGGNVRWGVTPNLTLHGAVNPDFSQVEADAGQFQYDPRSAVYFSEKRPFFLDGLEQFETPNRLIYTRRVADPLFAAKLNGKAGATTLAALVAIDGQGASRCRDERPLFAIARVQRDLLGSSRVALVSTTRADGDDLNQVLAADARFTFGGIWTARAQGAIAWTREQGRSWRAPLFDAQLDRNGRRFGLRYRLVGIAEDFVTRSGFISRPGVANVNLDHRISWYGAAGALVERFDTDLVFDGVWQYRKFVGEGGIQDRKFHWNNNASLRGGWRAGFSILKETFGYDEGLYADYALQRPDGGLDPFVGTPRLPNLDFVFSLDTPQWKTFFFQADWLFGRDENFFEWASADIDYLTLRGEWRPDHRVRLEARYQLQQFHRRTDGSLVGRRQIPRVKLEYQLTRAAFFRVVAEYDARFQDALRDDSRTELPIVLVTPTGVAPLLRQEEGRLRLDLLFSWQPRPGTVVFLGYGSVHAEPRNLRFDALDRRSDALFLKLSYLFRR